MHPQTGKVVIVWLTVDSDIPQTIDFDMAWVQDVYSFIKTIRTSPTSDETRGRCGFHDIAIYIYIYPLNIFKSGNN